MLEDLDDLPKIFTLVWAVGVRDLYSSKRLVKPRHNETSSCYWEVSSFKVVKRRAGYQKPNRTWGGSFSSNPNIDAITRNMGGFILFPSLNDTTLPSRGWSWEGRYDVARLNISMSAYHKWAHLDMGQSAITPVEYFSLVSRLNWNRLQQIKLLRIPSTVRGGFLTENLLG